MVVLSYHSLEDRLTKQAFAARARSSGPVDLPVELPGTGPTLRLLSRGAEPPTEAEVAANPRAASVRLRAAERIDPDAPGLRIGDRPRTVPTVSEGDAPCRSGSRKGRRQVPAEGRDAASQGEGS